MATTLSASYSISTCVAHEAANRVDNSFPDVMSTILESAVPGSYEINIMTFGVNPGCDAVEISTPYVIPSGVSLTINGSKSSNLIIKRAPNTVDHIFQVQTGAELNIKRLTVDGVNATSETDPTLSLIQNNGVINMDYVIVKNNNAATDYGGGLSNLAQGSSFSVNHSVFENLSSSQNVGGAIYSEIPGEIYNSTFTDNRGTGSALDLGSQLNGDVKIAFNTFIANWVTESQKLIERQDSNGATVSTVMLFANIFTNNYDYDPAPSGGLCSLRDSVVEDWGYNFSTASGDNSCFGSSPNLKSSATASYWQLKFIDGQSLVDYVAYQMPFYERSMNGKWVTKIPSTVVRPAWLNDSVIEQDLRGLTRNLSGDLDAGATLLQNCSTGVTASDGALLPGITDANSDLAADGLIGRYRAEDYNPETRRWRDSSGRGNDMGCDNIVGKGLTKGTNYGSQDSSQLVTVSGGINDGLIFPASPSNKSQYTFVTIARYNPTTQNTNKARIFDGLGSQDLGWGPLNHNWLSGFWGSKSGVSYHDDGNGSGWLTSDQSDLFHNSWVLSIDRPQNYRANGVDLGVTNQISNFPESVTINQGNYSKFIDGYNIIQSETSNWQISDVLIFDRQLSGQEISSLESDLAGEFHACIGSSCIQPRFLDANDGGIFAELNVGQSFSQALAISGPNLNSVSLVEGSLPPGIDINPSTNSLEGAATHAGNYKFTLRVTNPDGMDQSVFNIVVHEPERGCIDYRGASFANNILLDSNGYPIGCDLTDSSQSAFTPSPQGITWDEAFHYSDTNGPATYSYATRNGWACDDCSIGLSGASNPASLGGIPLGFAANIYGSSFDSVYVNSNGSLTFSAPSTCYNHSLGVILTCNSDSGVNTGFIPYGSDLDNRDLYGPATSVWDSSRHSEFFYWGGATVNGHQAFVATWMNSHGYLYRDNPFDVSQMWSTFQVVIESTGSSDPGDPTYGSVKVHFNYGSLSDVGSGYGPLRDLENPEYCGAISERCIAIGMGYTTINSDTQAIEPHLTSLNGQNIAYNGLGADEVIDNGSHPLIQDNWGSESYGVYAYNFGTTTSPPIATAPSPPGNLTVSNSDGALSVAWDAPSDDGGAPIVKYALRYRTVGATEWTQVDDILATQYGIIGLSNGTEYEIQVAANNGIGLSEFSYSANAVPSALPAPSNIQFDRNAYVVSWNAPANYSGPSTITYSVAFSTDGQNYTLLQDNYSSDTATGLTSSSFGSPYLNINQIPSDTNFTIKVTATYGVEGIDLPVVKSFTTPRTICPKNISCQDPISKWEEVGWNVNDAVTSQGNNDPFDGALGVRIGQTYETSTYVPCDSSTVTSVVDQSTYLPIGQSIECSSALLDGLTIRISRFAFDSSQWMRTKIDIVNGGSAYQGKLWFSSNLGSDEETTFETSDFASNPQKWVVTSDGPSVHDDPVEVHILDPRVSAMPTDLILNVATNVSPGSEYLIPEYDLSLAPAESDSYMFFDGLVGFDSTDADSFTGAYQTALDAANNFPLYSEHLAPLSASNPAIDLPVLNQSATDQFIKGNFVEVGVAPNGHFGSSGQAPAGYHSLLSDPETDATYGAIGFVSDRNKDGWEIEPNDGDFFLPGGPFEGFGVDVDGNYFGNSDRTEDIPTQSTGKRTTDTTQSAIWRSARFGGNSLNTGLSVLQTATVGIDGQSLDVTVRLTNNDSVTHSDIYYSRQVDPDNCVDHGGSYDTENTVVAQADSLDKVSLIQAVTNDSCRSDYDPSNPGGESYLGLISTDDRSKVGVQTGSFGSRSGVGLFSDTGDYETNLGYYEFEDNGIGIGFDIGTLQPNQSTTINFSYILSAQQAQEIIDGINNGTGLVAPAIALTQSTFATQTNTDFSTPTDWIDSVGSSPISYFTVSPTLPAGLTLNSASGQISGVAIDNPSTTTYTLTAHNLAGTSSADFSLATYQGASIYSDAGGLKISFVENPSATNYRIVLNRKYHGATVDESTLDLVGGANTSGVALVGLPGFEYSATVSYEFADTVMNYTVNSNVYYRPINSCRHNDDPRKVVYLSKYSTDNSGYETAVQQLDNDLVQTLCNYGVDVSVFNGSNGSEQGWQEHLANATDLIVPSSIGSRNDLVNSSIMSSEAAQFIRSWVRDGGRIHILGQYEQINLLNAVSDLNLHESDFGYEPATPELFDPLHQWSYPIGFPDSLQTTGQSLLLANNLPEMRTDSNFSVESCYQYVGCLDFIAAGIIPIENGAIGTYSEDLLNEELSGEQRNAWFKVLIAGLSGHFNKSISASMSYGFISNAGTSISDVSLTHTNDAFDGALRVRFGGVEEPTTLQCIDTLERPSMIEQSNSGVKLTCGWSTIDIGLTEIPLQARIVRWMSKSSPWIRTSVEIANNSDQDVEIDVSLFSDLGSDSATTVEASSANSGTTTSIPASSTWFVTSAGDQIRREFGYDQNDPIILQTAAQFGSNNFGGPIMDDRNTFEGYNFNRSQTISTSYASVNAHSSKTMSWFTGLVDYEPGCDREAVQLAATAADEVVSEYSEDSDFSGFNVDPAELDLPSLSLSSCSATSDSTTVWAPETEVQQHSAQISWNSIDSATNYEMQVQVDGESQWTAVDVSEHEDEENVIHSYASSLQPSTRYVVRVRAKFGSAVGPWAVSQSFMTASADVPSPSPSPSETVSPTESPTPTNSPTPSVSPTPSPTPSGLTQQTPPTTPAKLKVNAKLQFANTLRSLPLTVRSTGACKTTPVMKKVRVIIARKAKLVNKQTGWLVTAGAKPGLCSITFSNSGNSTTARLSAIRRVQIVK